jgi:hypothetical protein
VTDEPTATGAHRSPARGPSRRTFLISGGIAVVLGAGGGVATELRRPGPRHKTPTPPPANLVSALAAERSLIASIDASLRGTGASRDVLSQLRADHVAHEQALLGALALASDPEAPAPTPSPSPRTSTTVPALTDAQLRTAERRASSQAAVRAGRMTGRDATLLASIAACEATHAELLA